MRHPLCRTTSAISHVHVFLNRWLNRQDQSESKTTSGDGLAWCAIHPDWNQCTLRVNAPIRSESPMWTLLRRRWSTCVFWCCVPLTWIPTNLVVHFAHQHLQDYSSLSEHTAFTPGEIVSWLEFCRNATYLVFHFAYYQHILGTAIGSLDFIVAANLVVEDVESRALSTYPSHPRSGSDVYTKPVVP